MNHSDKRNSVAAASFVLALIAIATFQIFFISLPCASLSVILALISRGEGGILPRAKAAIVCAVIAAVLTTSITAYSVYTVMHDPQLMSQVESIYDYYMDPSGSGSAPGAESGKDAQDLIRDILSGEYRKNQKTKAGSGQDLPSGSAVSDNGPKTPAPEAPAAVQIGGSVI